MANMAGVMTPLEHSIHILDAAYLMDGLYEEAINCVIELYSITVLIEALPKHMDKILINKREMGSC